MKRRLREHVYILNVKSGVKNIVQCNSVHKEDKYYGFFTVRLLLYKVCLNSSED